MSIDDLARAAAADAHRRAEQEVVPMTMLEDLHRTRRSRTVGTVIAMAAVVVTASVVSLTLLDREGGRDAAPGTVGLTVTPSSGTDACSDPDITCLGDARYTVALTVPVTVTVPATFEGALSRLSDGTLEDYRNDVDETGVTVFERATAVKGDASWSADPAAGQSAQSMASWLYHRPFLVDATMTRTTVGGLTAWRVSATLKPGADLPAAKAGVGSSVAPTFTGDDGRANAGYGDRLTGDYTLVDVPGAGVTVIWSWTLADDRAVLQGNQPYIDSLSFG